jgi:ribosomal-protein-alanine N-acetyltransferase
MHTEFLIFPVIETARLSLRRLSIADAEAIYELRSDPEVARLTGKEPFTNVDEAVAYIQKIERLFEENGCVFWAISYKDSSALIGAICFWN